MRRMQLTRGGGLHRFGLPKTTPLGVHYPDPTKKNWLLCGEIANSLMRRAGKFTPSGDITQLYVYTLPCAVCKDRQRRARINNTLDYVACLWGTVCRTLK